MNFRLFVSRNVHKIFTLQLPLKMKMIFVFTQAWLNIFVHLLLNLEITCDKPVQGCNLCVADEVHLDHTRNSRYPQYAIWPRDGAGHANHACAALTVSQWCRQAFVFFHWKCTQVLQNPCLSIIQTCFKKYHELLRHLVAFSKFECLCRPIQN